MSGIFKPNGCLLEKLFVQKNFHPVARAIRATSALAVASLDAVVKFLLHYAAAT
jgi:hypothetical protein